MCAHCSRSLDLINHLAAPWWNELNITAFFEFCLIIYFHKGGVGGGGGEGEKGEGEGAAAKRANDTDILFRYILFDAGYGNLISRTKV